MSDHNEAMSQLPHNLATLIKCLPQAPFRDHLAAECIKQAERIAELESLSTGLSTVYNEAMDSLRIVVDERDTLRAEVGRLRVNAERYEWLRDCHPADKSLWVAMGLPHAPGGVSCWRNDELDATIDTARKATQ